MEDEAEGCDCSPTARGSGCRAALTHIVNTNRQQARQEGCSYTNLIRWKLFFFPALCLGNFPVQEVACAREDEAVGLLLCAQMAAALPCSALSADPKGSDTGHQPHTAESLWGCPAMGSCP